MGRGKSEIMKMQYGSHTLSKKDNRRLDRSGFQNNQSDLKGHCIEFKYYADGIHYGLTPPS